MLIIPLQFFLGQLILKLQTTSTTEAVNNLQEIARRISGFNSEEQLRAYAGSLPNPIYLPAKFDAAFPVIKNRAVENIKAQINAINNNVQLQKTASQQTRIQALCSLRWRPCMVSARLRSAASSTDALPQG